MKYINAEDKEVVVEYNFEGNDANSIKLLSDDYFMRNGFKNLGIVGNRCSYEKGSRVMRMLFGAFVSYHKHDLLFESSDNRVRVKFISGSSGMSGGLIGINAVKQEFKRTAFSLDEFYKTQTV